MYLATAAVILLLTNAAYVHADCAIKPDATTGAVVIPASWTEIEDNAFIGCTTIKSVVIQEKIVIIQNYAFALSPLEEILFLIGSQLETIGQAAFQDTKITKVKIPRSVKTIDLFAFLESQQLEEVVFEDGSLLETIGDRAFSGTQIKTINIPAGVAVGADAFQNTPCPDNTIFRSGANIVNCIIVTHAPSNVPSEIMTSPPTHAPSNNYCAVTPDPTTGAVEIPADWTEIGVEAFYKCTTIKSVLIPTKIINIREKAFRDSKLEEVKFEDGSQLEEIGVSAFYRTKIISIVIPTTIINILDRAFFDSQLEEVVFENGSQLHTIRQGVFYGTKIKKIEIPSSVKKINPNAFYQSDLEEVKFENGSLLETIGSGAFKETQLRTMSIPAGVAVGANAFQGTPCPDNTIFRSGAIIVNCTIVTHAPSSVPSEIMTSPPTHAPSNVPSEVTSSPPTHAPSSMPSEVTSSPPTQVTSSPPTHTPSRVPSEVTSSPPTHATSNVPSEVESSPPTHAPSSVQSEISCSPPTHAPSSMPSEISSNPPSVITGKSSTKTKKSNKFKKREKATKKDKAKKIME